MKNKIILKYYATNIGEHQSATYYQSQYHHIACLTKFENESFVGIEFSFNYPEYPIKNKLFLNLLDNKVISDNQEIFSFHITNIISLDSDKLMILGNLSIIFFDKKQVDNFSFLIPINEKKLDVLKKVYDSLLINAS